MNDIEKLFYVLENALTCAGGTVDNINATVKILGIPEPIGSEEKIKEVLKKYRDKIALWKTTPETLPSFEEVTEIISFANKSIFLFLESQNLIEAAAIKMAYPEDFLRRKTAEALANILLRKLEAGKMGSAPVPDILSKIKQDSGNF